MVLILLSWICQASIHGFMFHSVDNDELVQLTTTNSDDIIIIVILVIYLDDLGGQRASFLPIFLRAALLVNETIPLVSCLHQFLTLLYGPEEECGVGLLVNLGNTQHRPWNDNKQA